MLTLSIETLFELVGFGLIVGIALLMGAIEWAAKKLKGRPGRASDVPNVPREKG